MYIYFIRVIRHPHIRYLSHGKKEILGYLGYFGYFLGLKILGYTKYI